MLHELINRTDEQQGTAVLQGIGDSILAAFEELSLTDVMAHVQTSYQPIPEVVRTIELPSSDLRRQRQRLIKAHEALSELSEANQQEFADVIQSLKHDG